MRNAPPDAPLRRAISSHIEGLTADESIGFYDTDNELREVIYSAEFETGEIQRVRNRLEDMGILKAVVHFAAEVKGARGGHGLRVSVMEYIPDGKWYGMLYQPNLMTWAHDSDFRDALEGSKELFGNGKEEPAAEE